MKKLFTLLLLYTSSILPSENSSIKLPMPNFAKPIHLIAPRNLAQRLTEKYSDQIPAAVLAWLKTCESYSILENGIGRQLTQTAHDTQRKEIYSGELLKPSFIVLTASGKQTLDETVTSLKNAGLAHHFIINRNGDIHPITQENEPVQQALEHRFYTVGLSGRVIDGCYEQRDINSASISISVVMTQDQTTTKEQNQALCALTDYLKNEYQIRADQIIDYGCTACFADGKYGRRNSNPNIPWEKFACYPQLNDIERTEFLFKNDIEKTVWAALALRKIGMICPITNDSNNEHLKAALACFNQHAFGYRDPRILNTTIGALNSLIIQHETCNPKLQPIQPPSLPLRPEVPTK